MLKPEHKVRTICRVIELNPSTYYAHLKRGIRKREKANINIRVAIMNIYLTANKRFGAYKINNELREQRIFISIGKLYRLLATMQLPSIFTSKPPFKGCKAQDNPNFANLLKQNFNVSAPNKAWVSDITYVKVNGKFCYVCVILDLFARKVVAYKCGNSATKEFVIDTFNLALKNRNFPKNVIFHSDRGCQYTAKDFRKTIDRAGFIQSFSKPGYPYDNAVGES